MSLFSLDDRSPVVDSGSWIADTAVLIGHICIEAEVSVWFNAVLRGDNEPILISKGSNIQENVVLHTDLGFVLKIGMGTTVGHQATLHGCQIGDNVLIGMGATVLNGAQIGSNCIIGAGALVTEKKVIPEGSLAVGAPARVIRAVIPEEIAKIKQNAMEYVKKSAYYRRMLRRED